jgi:hypothetical protein
MQSCTPPSPWHMLSFPQSQQTNPPRNYGSNEQAPFGSPPGGAKYYFGMVLQFQMTYHHTPKIKVWTISIKKMIDEQSATAKKLKQSIGRFVHLGLAIPVVHHFMSRLRDLQFCATKRRSIKIKGSTKRTLCEIVS